MSSAKSATRQPTRGDEYITGALDGSAESPQLQSEVRALRQALVECQREGQALRESEELHRVILENVSDAVFLTDDQAAFTFVCPNCDMIFGYSREETWALGRISALFGDNGNDLPQLVNGRAIVNHECNITTKEGGSRTLLVNVKRVSIGGGTLLYVCRDITERKQTEAALSQSVERYRHIVEDQTEFICRYLQDGTLTFVNSAYARYFKRSVDSLIGTSFWDLIPQRFMRRSVSSRPRSLPTIPSRRLSMRSTLLTARCVGNIGRTAASLIRRARLWNIKRWGTTSRSGSWPRLPRSPTARKSSVSRSGSRLTTFTSIMKSN